MQRLLFVLFLICVWGYNGSTGDSVVPEYRKPNLGIYLAEGGASFFVGNVVGIGVPIFLAISFPLGEGHELADPSLAYFLLYPAIYSFTSAFGVDITAKIFKCKGSYWGAVGGGFLGLATGIGILYVTGFELMHPNFLTLTSVIILPPTFSVVGYNLFMKKDSGQSNIFLYNKKYIIARSYSMEKIDIPKISIKVVEIKF